jgi:hypothetical protein
MSKRITLLVAVFCTLAAGTALADGNPPVAEGPFAGTVHAVAAITYKDGSQQAWNWDRGRITALSATSITLMRRDRQQVTFTITASTAVRNDGASYQLGDLETGLAATVISQDGAAVVIRAIRGDGAPNGGDPSAIAGPLERSVTGSVDAQYVDASHQTFEYDRGLITQAGSGQVSVKRLDGQTVTFTYDATTLVRDCRGQLESTDLLAQGEVGMFFSQGGALKLAGCLHQPQAHRPSAH